MFCFISTTVYIMFSWLQAYYDYLVFVRFQHYLWISYSLINIYITILAQFVVHSLVHWYQQCVTVHDVPKHMSCHKAIVVITVSAHVFPDDMYIMPILLLWISSTSITWITYWYQQYVTVHLRSCRYIYIIYIILYICISSCHLSNPRHTGCSSLQDGHNIYEIMKTIYHPGNHHNIQ